MEPLKGPVPPPTRTRSLLRTLGGGKRRGLPKIDLGGRPLFGPIGAVAARAVKGDIERSIERFESLYS